MKIARTFKEKESKDLPTEVLRNEYLQAFAQKMVHLSNRLNEVEDDDEYRDDFDIKEEYLPAIQEFFQNMEGF